MAYKDSLPAWMVNVAGCMLYFITSGNLRSSGVLFIPLMEVEGLNRRDASWPFNLPGACTVVAAPLVGFLISRWRATTLAAVASTLFVLGQIPAYFTTNIFVLSIFYGIVRGFGIPMISILGNLVTSVSFDRHRSMAMGLNTLGSPLGGLVMPLLAQVILAEYGLRGTFLVLAGVSMHAYLFSLAYMRFDKYAASCKKPASENKPSERTPLLGSNEDIKNEDEQTKSRPSEKEGHKEPAEGSDRMTKATDSQILKNIFTSRGYYFLTASQVSSFTSTNIFSQVIIDYMRDKGIVENTSVYMIASTSAGDIVGKMCLGLLTDKKVLSLEFHTALFTALSAGTLVLLIWTANIPVLMVVSFFFGLFQGTIVPTNLVHLSHYLRKEELPLAMSLTKSFVGIMFFAIPLFIGLFRDTLGSYDGLFFVTAAVMVALALVFVVEGIFMSCKRRKAHHDIVR